MIEYYLRQRLGYTSTRRIAWRLAKLNNRRIIRMLTKAEKQLLCKNMLLKKEIQDLRSTNRSINSRYQQIKWTFQTTSKDNHSNRGLLKKLVEEEIY